ncbi:hypothetical protein BD769DRAFT_1474969 [Suillus cothurnatus]|nr:hypothetical protein BD769DRAFT_1474969 [Suillus cothurnatus]
MLNRCVDDYIKLMSQLPSFNTDVDVELERYSHAMENFAQEATLWYWYFRGVDATNRDTFQEKSSLMRCLP